MTIVIGTLKITVGKYMGNQTDYFNKIGYKHTYNIGDRVFGHYNKIPFVVLSLPEPVALAPTHLAEVQRHAQCRRQRRRRSMKFHSMPMASTVSWAA